MENNSHLKYGRISAPLNIVLSTGHSIKDIENQANTEFMVNAANGNNYTAKKSPYTTDLNCT